MKPRRIVAIAVIGLAAIVAVSALGFLAWTRASRYEAFPSARALVAGDVKTAEGWYAFRPDAPDGTGLVFYPGGLVDPAAYAPLMKAVSERGILAVIVPMPLDLAFAGVSKADSVIAAFPEIRAWAIGGHSLGGAMAAQYVKDRPGAVRGLALLASYPAENVDLSGLPIPALSIYGTRDGLAADEFVASFARLPGARATVALEGGNHAQFGDYGPQKGDGVATMSREEQQARTVEAVVALMRAASE
ncbi:MAG: alpha/beta hydrolase [Spirochaetes bacterium]|nr:alpha/beta hydrolase [Spirochaetota bacterium]MBU1081757.1 alpha/beta hydrolase [Spirochaetota bacterium]